MLVVCCRRRPPVTHCFRTLHLVACMRRYGTNFPPPVAISTRSLRSLAVLKHGAERLVSSQVICSSCRMTEGKQLCFVRDRTKPQQQVTGTPHRHDRCNVHAGIVDGLVASLLSRRKHPYVTRSLVTRPASSALGSNAMPNHTGSVGLCPFQTHSVIRQTMSDNLQQQPPEQPRGHPVRAAVTLPLERSGDGQ